MWLEGAYNRWSPTPFRLATCRCPAEPPLLWPEWCLGQKQKTYRHSIMPAYPLTHPAAAQPGRGHTLSISPGSRCPLRFPPLLKPRTRTPLHPRPRSGPPPMRLCLLPHAVAPRGDARASAAPTAACERLRQTAAPTGHASKQPGRGLGCVWHCRGGIWVVCGNYRHGHALGSPVKTWQKPHQWCLDAASYVQSSRTAFRVDVGGAGACSWKLGSRAKGAAPRSCTVAVGRCAPGAVAHAAADRLLPPAGIERATALAPRAANPRRCDLVGCYGKPAITVPQ
jgi:hypothetical protein